PTLARIAAVGIGPRAAPLSAVLAAHWRSTLPKVLSALRTERQEPGRAQAGWTYPKDDLGKLPVSRPGRALRPGRAGAGRGNVHVGARRRRWRPVAGRGVVP